MIGNFLATGRYPVERMVTLTQAGDSRPHLMTRQGAPVNRLAGHMDENSIITTGQFNGRQMTQESHLGFFETTVNILHSPEDEEMFGFAWPGSGQDIGHVTFLSALFKGPSGLTAPFTGN